MPKTERPSLDEIAADPARVSGLSEPVRLQLIARCAAIVLELTKADGEQVEHARKLGLDDQQALIGDSLIDDGRLLTSEELAALMRVKVGWVHRHGHPFAIRLPGQSRVKRYSYAGYLRYSRARQRR